MFESREDIDALLGQAEETASLEFKSGLFFNGFGIDPRKRSELIKDVTGFANAGGGTLIFGVSERQVDGKSVADAIEPVANGVMSRDQLTQIIHANTDPPLAGFRINTFDAEGGLIIVIEVDEGYTATQNKLDYLFWQRVEATNVRMGGYAIRDVMNRRTSPVLDAGLSVRLGEHDGYQHSYAITPYLRNVGARTARHWRLLVELPAGLRLRFEAYVPQLVFARPDVNYDGLRYQRFEYSSERAPAGTSLQLLPGEEFSFEGSRGFPGCSAVLVAELGNRFLQVRPPLRWTLHVDDASPTTGMVPYQDWCSW